MSWFAKLSPWHCEREEPKVSAADEARQRRRAVEETWQEVDQISAALEVHRRKNHFGESLEKVFRGVA
nr:MAG TPA: hypothetical protein [Caudoviricetes sp.]